jgi:hypothetical protein
MLSFQHLFSITLTLKVQGQLYLYSYGKAPNVFPVLPRT